MSSRALGRVGAVILQKIFTEIMESWNMPDEWRGNKLIAIFKNEGNIQGCGNYNKLMSHIQKVWDRAIERRLREKAEISD